MGKMGLFFGKILFIIYNMSLGLKTDPTKKKGYYSSVTKGVYKL